LGVLAVQGNRALMNTLIDNGWIQSIIGGLIASGLIVIGKRLFAKRYSYRQAIFSVSVATLVFSFGQVLEPAVKGNCSPLITVARG
jgi:hypothetical protein